MLRLRKLDQPALVGLPEIAPVELFNVSPGGNAPITTLHAYGGVPPVADIWAVYAWPTVPLGRSAFIIVSGVAVMAAVTIDVTNVTVAPVESFA
jgi:hypothetical protein